MVVRKEGTVQLEEFIGVGVRCFLFLLVSLPLFPVRWFFFRFYSPLFIFVFCCYPYFYSSRINLMRFVLYML